MILIDYSQVALSTIFQFSKDLKVGGNSEDAVNIVRHAVLTGLKNYKKTYGAEYGEMVLCCDSKNYWRKQLFPYYKAGRKKQRDKSDLDWKLVFDTISDIRDDIAEHFPYRVIHVETAEADDIIAVLCKWSQHNGLTDHGMFETMQKVLIVSSDGDFKQLHKYPNVRQWSPMQKKYVECPEPDKYLMEHIAKAGDDGIPNVLSPSDVFVTEGVRQNRMTKQRLSEFVTRGRDACQTDEERSNWDRNAQLINLDLIPEEICAKITTTFENATPKGTKRDVFDYLMKHRCLLLLEDVTEF